MKKNPGFPWIHHDENVKVRLAWFGRFSQSNLSMDTHNTTHSPSGIQSDPIQERLSVQTKTGDIGNIFLERNSSSKDSGYFTSASEKDSGYLTAACEKDADYCPRVNEKDTSYYTVPSENDCQYGIAVNDIEFCTEFSENEATRDNCTASNAIDPGFCTASSVQDGGYCTASVQDGGYCTASSVQEADYSTVRSISGDYNFASMDEDEVENSSIPDLDKHLRCFIRAENFRIVDIEINFDLLFLLICR